MKINVAGGLAVSALLFVAPLSIASAADMPLKAPPPAPPPVYSWTGFYVGGNVGYGWGESTNRGISFTDPGPFFIGFAPYFALGGNVFPNLSPKGIIGGGQIGYDKQFNSFVLGIVADFQGADIKASTTAAFPGAGGFVASTQTLSQKLDSLGTVRARAGLASGNWLFYGSAGGAYGRATSTMNFNAPTAGVTFAGQNAQNLGGWAAGAGANWGITQNWVLGIDWLHYSLGHTTVSAVAVASPLPAPGASLTATQRVAGDIVRGTISYRF